MSDICWIEGNPPVMLAIVLRPRGGEWLGDELARMKRGGIQTLVSLLEEEEAGWLGLAEEPELAARAGMDFVSFPIPDTQVPPNRAAFRQFVVELANRLRHGERIGVHCRGSIGRSTITAAATLIHMGWKADAALAAIQQARGCPVPDTVEQKRWILAYEARP
jgi:protein-tyrosine phosphatase